MLTGSLRFFSSGWPARRLRQSNSSPLVRRSGAARELLVRQESFAEAKEVAEKLFAHRISGLSDDAFKMWRTAIRQGRIPPEPGKPHPAEFGSYVDELVALTTAITNLEACLAREVGEARARLLQTSRAILPAYLVFGSGEVQNLFSSISEELRAS